MSKLGGLAKFIAKEAKIAHQKRLRKGAYLRKLDEQYNMDERLTLFDYLYGDIQHTGEDTDWRYQAGLEFFNLSRTPPKMTFMDIFSWEEKSREIKFWEHKRNMIEKFLGVKYEKGRWYF